MTRTLRVVQAAQDEAEAQAAYYFDHAGTVVALAFVAEIEAIYRGLVEGRLPEILDRFPYAVVFFVEADTVHIVAIEAFRRRPGYWRSRLREK